jgi:hypothetical protein
VTQHVELPNGDSIDFPDGMPQDQMDDAVRQHLAAPDTDASTSGGSSDGRWSLPALLHMPSGVLQGNPTMEAADRAVGPVARTGVRVLSAVPNLATTVMNSAANAAVTGDEGGTYDINTGAYDTSTPQAVASKTGGVGSDARFPLSTAPPQLPTPSEALIDKLGISAPPDQSTASKTAESILPFLFPNANTATRVSEAPGAFNKVMTLGRTEAGNAADWFVSGEAQKYAEAHGWGPVATAIAGMVGANASTAASRVATPFVPKVVGAKPDAGETFDVNKDLLPPEGSTVSTVPTFKDVADPTSSIARFISGGGAIPFSGTGADSAANAQRSAIARTADAALTKLDPGTTPVMQAGPSSLRAEGSALANQSRDAIMNEEHRLMDESNAIESQIGLGTRVDAAPLRNTAAQLAQDNTVGETVRAQAQNVLDNLDKSIGSDGKIAYGALKNERSTFGQYLDNLAAPSTGDPSIRNTLARALSPIKDAMTERMAATADSVSPDLGAQWRQNDAGWTVQGAMKRNLASIGGVLTPDRTGFDPSPGGKQVAKTLSNAVEGTGKGGTAPITQIEQGLGDQPARSAVAETIAAQGRPKNAKGTQNFQPSTFGEGVQSRVDPDILTYVEQKAGPEARQNLENAAEAGSRTSEPMEQGGLRRMIGSIVGAAPYLGAASAVVNPGVAALSPLTALLVSATHDPDFIRAMANRSRPISDLTSQLATHAGLGTISGGVDPMEALRQGVGAGARAVTSGVNTIPSILKYLTQSPASTR